MGQVGKPKRIKLELSEAEADALRWACNEGLATGALHYRVADVARAALSELVRSMGLTPYQAGSQIYGRRATQH